jgi:hypothetical protein
MKASKLKEVYIPYIKHVLIARLSDYIILRPFFYDLAG